VRCCVSRALTLLLAISAGCGGGEPPAPAVPPDLRAHTATTDAPGRAALLTAAERAITADARSRRELEDRTRRTDCKPRKGEDAKADAVVYDCLAVTFEIKGTVNAPPLASGYPFQVRVEYPERRFTWCKIRPPGGEGTGRPGREIAPPDACGGTG
jgi:hypothetical protein